MVIPSVMKRFGPFGTADAEKTLRRAGEGHRKLRERHLTPEDEISESVQHG